MIPTERTPGGTGGANHGPSMYAYRRSVVRDNGRKVTPGAGAVVLLGSILVVLAMFALAALLMVNYGG